MKSEIGQDALDRLFFDARSYNGWLDGPVTDDRMPELAPYRPESREFFAGNEEFAKITAFRNGSLQGAYFPIAARAVGLDCGPMSGFFNDGVDKEFFPDGRYKSNFICGLGRGDPESIFGRLPRLDFDAACAVL